MGLSTRSKTYDSPPPAKHRATDAHSFILELTEERTMKEKGTASSADTSTSTVCLYTLTCHALRSSIVPFKVSKFVNYRERYELKVEQKKAELPTLTVVSFTSFMERKLLKHMVLFGDFDDVAPDKTTEELTSDEIR